MSAPFGATYAEWWHFDVELGLTADLLPVVSNPHAPISPDSRMKGLGKTPSIYNRRAQVVGLAKWTERQTTTAQIEQWAQNDDYGICIQTRLLRALDIDVPDVRLAARIQAAFVLALGLNGLPMRTRADTGKRLLAFVLVGDFAKRSFKVDGGLVEFLANGQQFVAIGQHPSGSRYTWRGGLPTEFIEITAEQFEHAWAVIVAEFALEPERRASSRIGSGLPEGYEATDDVAGYLALNWPTYGEQGGKLYCLCPWKSGHSADSGETEACWLLAGTNGYARGHFECLHASCTGRTDADFLGEVGYSPATADDFEDLTAGQEGDEAEIAAEYEAEARAEGVELPEGAPKVQALRSKPTSGVGLPLPGFVRTKQGEIEAILPNVVKALAAVQACGIDLKYDTFRDELMTSAPGLEQWATFVDADAVDLRIALEGIRFKPVGKELMRDALVKLARDRQFDSAVFWLEHIVPEWDGVERIANFYPTYFKTKDSAYTRACGEYVWTAHPGRVLVPGVKADMVPVMVGAQGLRKSSGVAAISPDPEFFAELDMEVKDVDLGRKMRGVLVGELGELRGLNTREGEAIRAWVVRRFEEWTPKYMERKQRFWRRLVLHGTTNDEEFLSDPTGERRWLPMTVLDMVDVAGIERDRLQLWAEGRERFKAEGVLWQRAEELAKAEHPDFKASDLWLSKVSSWLDERDLDGTTPRQRGDVRAEDVLLEACGADPGRVRKVDQQRVAACLRACGMRRNLRRLHGRVQRVWEDENGDLA